MPLAIAQLGQPVLRAAAKPVQAEEIATAEFRQLLSDMKETMLASSGVGLAAPQVFVSRRIFLARIVPADPEKPDAPPSIDVFINPRIVAATQEVESAWEGCLSFPELLVLVPRRKGIRIEYLDPQGRSLTAELHGYPARVVQHEYDHLDGVLTIDRAASTRDIIKASEIKAVLGERGPAKVDPAPE
jgi:peptide deformylase